MRRMRRIPALAVLAGGLILWGCGAPGDSTPVACLRGTDTYLKALQRAPGEVRLGDETPISDCLAENQQGGDLATVGVAMVTAATRLNGEARADPGDAANLRLGYLLGAAKHGAGDTEGIHADLIRRLVAAARYSPDNRPLPSAFRRAYRRGFDAGSARG
jgi:hypothetical protein